MLCICGKLDSGVQRSERSGRAGRARFAPRLAWRQAQLALSVVHLMRRERRDGRLWAKRPSPYAPTSPCHCCLGRLVCSSAGRSLVWGSWMRVFARCGEGIAAIAATSADMGMAYYLCALRACLRRARRGKRRTCPSSAGVRHTRQVWLQLPAARAIEHQRRVAIAPGPGRRCYRRLIPAVAGGRPRARCETGRTEGRASARSTLVGSRARERGPRSARARIWGVQRGFRHARSG